MKSLKEQLNEAQINEARTIYVLVKGENHYGINDLLGAYSNEREANKAKNEYEESNKVTDPDYLEVIEVDLH